VTFALMVRHGDDALAALLHAGLIAATQVSTGKDEDCAAFDLMHEIAHTTQDSYGLLPVTHALTDAAASALLSLKGEAKFADLVFSKVEGTWTFVLADKKPEIPVRVYDDMARAAQLICVKIGMYADVPLVRKRKGPWGLDRYELSPGTVADTASWVAMLQAIPAKQHCEVVRALFSVVAGLIGMADRGARR